MEEATDNPSEECGNGAVLALGCATEAAGELEAISAECTLRANLLNGALGLRMSVIHGLAWEERGAIR